MERCSEPCPRRGAGAITHSTRGECLAPVPGDVTALCCDGWAARGNREKVPLQWGTSCSIISCSTWLRENQTWSCRGLQRALGEQVGWALFSFRKESLPFLVFILHLSEDRLVLSGRQEQPQDYLSVQRMGHVPLGSCCVPWATKPHSWAELFPLLRGLPLGRLLPLHSPEIAVGLKEWARCV